MSAKRRTSTLLVADDDSVVRKLIAYQFEQAGLYCDLFESGELLLAAANEETQVCLLDLQMPGKSGLECLHIIKKNYPNIEVIILTNVNQAAEALEAVRVGAFDYITKPFDPEELTRAIRKAMKLSRQQKENLELRSSLSLPNLTVDILGDSNAMVRVKTLITRLGPSENTILLTGESGTGKTLLAHAIHARSTRTDGPFVSVSCPSLPGDLLESEMFGHEKGAFSGAIQRRLGRAELANHGTLFLDEIGDMPLSIQAKLLTFLQEKTFYRVGGEKLLSSDVRIIAATNHNLEDLIRKGQFREDLYFRLNVLPLEVPSLRDRASDISTLLDYFLAQVAKQASQPPPKVAPELYGLLSACDWPGNIRELKNAIIRAYTLRQNDQMITSSDFAFCLQNNIGDRESDNSVKQESVSHRLAGMSLAEIEKLAIEQTLSYCNNNKSEAARTLGIAEKSIYNKIRKHGILLSH